MEFSNGVESFPVCGHDRLTSRFDRSLALNSPTFPTSHSTCVDCPRVRLGFDPVRTVADRRSALPLWAIGYSPGRAEVTFQQGEARSICNPVVVQASYSRGCSEHA